MATTSPPPSKTNLVPTISPAVLPSPTADWADSVDGILGAHVTRTPVGTPGPDVPGGFPALTEPDMPASISANSDSTSGGANTNAGLGLGSGAGTLLETAKAYLPAHADVQRVVSNAKAYLPEGVAAYLPDNTVNSTAPTSLPRQDTTSSTAVDVGHGAAVPYTSGGPEPYTLRSEISLAGQNTLVREDTSASMTVHTGHNPSADTSGVPSQLDTTHPGVVSPTASGTLSQSDAHLGVSSAASSNAALVASPPALTPRTSTNLALAAQRGSAAPQSTMDTLSNLASSGVSESAKPNGASESASSVHLVSTPTPQSSFTNLNDGAPHARLDPSAANDNVHSVPTASLDGVHSTPHAVPAPASHLISQSPVTHATPASSVSQFASTPSLVPSTDSGYTASQESESGLATPVDAPRLFSSHLDPASFRPLNANGSAAAPSSTTTTTASVPSSALGADDAQAYPSPPEPRTLPSTATADSGYAAERESLASADGAAISGHNVASDNAEPDSSAGDEVRTGEDGNGKGKKEKKPKLMQRLKQKIQGGGGSGGEK